MLFLKRNENGMLLPVTGMFELTLFAQRDGDPDNGLLDLRNRPGSNFLSRREINSMNKTDAPKTRN